jgi:hypothetical protein
MLAIGMAWMSADDDAELSGELERSRDFRNRSGMRAARDVCGSDEGEQLGVVARPFAEITIEIDDHGRLLALPPLTGCLTTQPPL